MKVWIDVLTPKQANLFSVIVRELRKRGHDIFVTTRHYREVEQLLKIRHIDAMTVGRHGGADLHEKLLASAERETALANCVSQEKPGIAMSFCSPEAARVAYGLRISHYAVCDSPHAEAVCRLSLPVSEKLFTPKAIPKAAWKWYGIAPKQIVRYNAIDPVVWIRAYAPGPDLRKELGLKTDKPMVIIRTEEEFAAYMLQSKVFPSKTIITTLARSLNKTGVQVVVLPRYESQVDNLVKILAGTAIVPTQVVDAIGLLSRATAFIGAGGTMSAEAALMGVPTISCYPIKPTYIDKYLFRTGLAERILTPHKIINRVHEHLNNNTTLSKQKKRAENIMSRMEDPVQVILNQLTT